MGGGEGTGDPGPEARGAGNSRRSSLFFLLKTLLKLFIYLFIRSFIHSFNSLQWKRRDLTTGPPGKPLATLVLIRDF